MRESRGRVTSEGSMAVVQRGEVVAAWMAEGKGHEVHVSGDPDRFEWGG